MFIKPNYITYSIRQQAFELIDLDKYIPWQNQQSELMFD